MKSLLAILAASLVIPLFVQRADALSTDATIKILPLHCKFEIVDDGTNEIRYITPGACGVKVNNPKSNTRDNAARNPIQGFPLWRNFHASDDTISARKVWLNDLAEYFTSNGTFVGMATNNIVHFIASDGTEHSVTVNYVGNDYLTITVASEPIVDTIYVGETKRFDPTNDGINDIEVSLQSISNGHADINFRQLNKASANNIVPVLEATETGNGKLVRSNTPLIIGAVIVFFGLILLVRKRHDPR